jgi:outer membrane protein OmpA-like peptidoglycan-associated protein
VLFFMLFLVISCAPQSHFGVRDQAIGAPSIFDETEAAVLKAEKSEGAKYCPDKIAKAKELGKKGVEVYWACRTDESLKLLAEARQLAKEAEACKPPAAPPAPVPPAPAPPKPAPPAPTPAPAPPAPAPAPAPPAPAPKPTPPPAPAPKPAPVLDTIYFDPNKTNITPTAAKALDRNGALLKENPKIRVEIGGHTDSGGSETANQAISDKRAQSAKKYLIDKFGIAENRLVAKGFGSTKPVADNQTNEGRAKNRRVEFRIIP